VAGASSRVRLDLNSPEFQDVFFRLDAPQVNQVVASLRRLRQLDWSTLYQHSGFHWEAVEHLKAPNGARVYSLRLSQKVRAIAYRDGDFLRLISLHPDHDSAYER
jgi:UDP-3-O-acyl-N-acetylglucosamine deacetylase